MKTRIVYHFIAIVISALALTSVANLSSYSHETDNTLMTTQARLQALQQNYDQLKADHEALGKDYDQTKSDLEAANVKVATLESELQTAKEENEKLGQTIKITKLNMSILEGLFDESVSLQEIENRIAATGDAELRSKWDTVNDQNSLGGFIVYLVHSVWGTLNS